MIFQVRFYPAKFNAFFFEFWFIIIPYEEGVNNRYLRFGRDLTG